MVEVPKKEKTVELRPDASTRFERAVDAAVKSGPKHRVKTEKNTEKRKRKTKTC